MARRRVSEPIPSPEVEITPTSVGQQVPSRIKRQRVQVTGARLPPLDRYMAILAARDQHRSLGQFVAWAVSEKLRTLTFRVTCDNRTEQVSTEEAVALLWSVEEADRVVKLGMHAPHLMTFEEQVAYQRIVEDGAVWVAMDMPDLPRIRAKWAVYTEGLAMEHDNP